MVAKLAERATSATAASERTREAGQGGRYGGEASRSEGEQLPRPAEREHDAWLASRLAAAGASTASRVAATIARRAATLTTVSTFAPAPARQGAAAARQEARHSRLLHERERGERGGEQTPERPESGDGGRRRKYSFCDFKVDVGAWNWADDVGSGGGAGMADVGRGVPIFKDGLPGRETGEWRTSTVKRGIASQERCSAPGAAGSGTAEILR